MIRVTKVSEHYILVALILLLARMEHDCNFVIGKFSILQKSIRSLELLARRCHQTSRLSLAHNPELLTTLCGNMQLLLEYSFCLDAVHVGTQIIPDCNTTGSSTQVGKDKH